MASLNGSIFYTIERQIDRNSYIVNKLNEFPDIICLSIDQLEFLPENVDYRHNSIGVVKSQDLTHSIEDDIINHLSQHSGTICIESYVICYQLDHDGNGDGDVAITDVYIGDPQMNKGKITAVEIFGSL